MTAERRGSGELAGDRIPGRRAVLELLRAQRRPVRAIWVTQGLETSPVLAEIVAAARDRGVRVHAVPAERVNTEARVESAQGVVALAEPVRSTPFDDLLGVPDALVVVLDGVTDPRNLGAVVRSAESAGATGLVVPRHRAAVLTPAAVKAAAGAVEHLPIAIVAGVPAALEQASRRGVWTVGLDADGDASIFELAVADAPIMLVLGSEGRGLARLTRARCEVLARIPMKGHTPSLNVSAAAAVACFEVVRQRHR